MSASTIGGLPQTEAVTTPFPDMEGSWYRYQEAVAYLQEKEVIGGYDDGTFRPKDPVNRAEFLKIVFKGRGGNEPVGRRCFSDVNPRAWYAPFVCAAERRGIVNGYPDGTFKPDQPVNAAEAMKMIMLAYGKEINERPGEQWYETYASALDRLDILPRDAFLPWEDINRERAADLITRFVRHEEDRVIPNLSAGCGKVESTAPSTVTVYGVERSFLLTVPTSRTSSDPKPLIIAFHGRTNSNEQIRAYYGLDRNASGYFIAYPAALKRDSGSFSWTDPNDKAGKLRDVALFDEIVKRLANDYCIDMDRIFVVGHSLGAWMANSVACIRGDVIRASATVGGDSVLTDCSGPAAALLMHNPNDNLASFSSAKKALDLRIKENACARETIATEPSSLKCVKHRDCDGGNTVVWCPHEINEDRRGSYYPHLWPDEMAQTIVTFFAGLE